VRSSLLKWLGWLIVSLLVSAIYLYGFPSPTVTYVVGVLIHSLLGIAGVFLFVPYAVRHFREWSVGDGVAWAVFALSAVLGVVLLFIGTARPQWSWLYAHEVVALLAVVALGAQWLARRPRLVTAAHGKVFALAVCVAVVGLMTFLSY
jgi:hypothetical protein